MVVLQAIVDLIVHYNWNSGTMLYTVHNWELGIFSKATSQTYNFLSGNFSKVG